MLMLENPFFHFCVFVLIQFLSLLLFFIVLVNIFSSKLLGKYEKIVRFSLSKTKNMQVWQTWCLVLIIQELS